MSVTVKEIAAYLESKAPLSFQESYDNAGLTTGDPYGEVTGVLITLDITEEIIDEALHHNCNLVISHHPLVFSPLKSLTGRTWVERTLLKAIKNDIALYAAHTNLDSMLQNGVNTKICEKLGLKDIQILDPVQGNLRKLVTFVPTA
ncbi:MAG TPA: Nif3-like dinuclear metal center hexameric protein, partial [Bacteroidales bacterium]|nr:Nif3-like dinuclear metal center hexameric protein [Bacteroidales bacterium]